MTDDTTTHERSYPYQRSSPEARPFGLPEIEDSWPRTFDWQVSLPPVPTTPEEIDKAWKALHTYLDDLVKRITGGIGETLEDPVRLGETLDDEPASPGDDFDFAIFDADRQPGFPLYGDRYDDLSNPELEPTPSGSAVNAQSFRPDWALELSPVPDDGDGRIEDVVKESAGPDYW